MKELILACSYTIYKYMLRYNNHAYLRLISIFPTLKVSFSALTINFFKLDHGFFY